MILKAFCRFMLKVLLVFDWDFWSGYYRPLPVWNCITLWSPYDGSWSWTGTRRRRPVSWTLPHTFRGSYAPSARAQTDRYAQTPAARRLRREEPTSCPVSSPTPVRTPDIQGKVVMVTKTNPNSALSTIGTKYENIKNTPWNINSTTRTKEIKSQFSIL